MIISSMYKPTPAISLGLFFELDNHLWGPAIGVIYSIAKDCKNDEESVLTKKEIILIEQILFS